MNITDPSVPDLQRHRVTFLGRSLARGADLPARSSDVPLGPLARPQGVEDALAVHAPPTTERHPS
jgi:hypothetical protein